ncbi:MAG: AAA family ATPase [Ignavibacteriales bacterium]|nr:AAA family ATPase [Ignavibacteriales bacterium]
MSKIFSRALFQIDKESGRILYFSNELKRTFDLSQVSSMVSELSIITAYLKFIIWDHVSLDQLDGEPSMSVGVFPTLFIEEPESHLHPEAQIKLMEYFVELAKMGLKIIMTTHSDYMSNKMGNLILAGKIEANNTGSYLLEKKKEGTACSKRKMRATDEGIEDANFHCATEKTLQGKNQAKR